MLDKSKDTIFVNIHVAHNGEAQVTHGPPGSRGGERAYRGSPRGEDSGESTPWKVAYQGNLYAISVTAGEMTISLDGETVWSGEREPGKVYRAQWSKLAPKVEAVVLDLARAGDKVAEEPAPVPPPSASRARATKATAQQPAAAQAAAPKRRGRPPKAKPEQPPAQESAPKKRGRPPKAKPEEPAAQKPPSKKGPVEVTAHSRRAPGSKPPAESKPASRGVARAAAAKVDVPPTQPSIRPIDDEKVMKELLRGLERAAPQRAAAAYASLRSAWFNGARELVLAWMKLNPGKRSVAKAYVDWAEENMDVVHEKAAEAA